MSETNLLLPMETVPLGMQVIPADLEKVKNIAGHATQIFPNKYETNNFLPGKQMLQFPGKTSPFKFQLVPPFGTETIKVIASTMQFSDLGQGLKDLGMATRGIMVVETESEEQDTMAEASVLYTIVPGN